MTLSGHLIALQRGGYRARLAETPEDLAAAQRLRARAFRLNLDSDRDRFDPLCRHVLIEDCGTGALVCCFRMMPLTGATISRSYSAQHYELSALEAYDGRMVELGRFCVDPDRGDPDILRIAWGALTRFVDAEHVDLLFGCSSFRGTVIEEYLDAFAILKARHLGPRHWLPRVKAPHVFRFGARLRREPDRRKAMARMPPLLKTYLMMGGWVSDHAVVDKEMNTLHVFTGVEVEAIPPARKRLLRSVAG